MVGPPDDLSALLLEVRSQAPQAHDAHGRRLVELVAGGFEPEVGRARVQAEGRVFSPYWSRDGRYLFYHEVAAETRGDIRYVELQPDGSAREPITFLGTPANEQTPHLSPNGRFLAYISDESGRREIYVRTFPDAGRWQASVNGGAQPCWRSDGGELYYLTETTLMAVSVSTAQGLTLGQPQALFEAPDIDRGYHVSADGQRFVTTVPFEADEPTPPTMRVVENWHEEFRDREQD